MSDDIIPESMVNDVVENLVPTIKDSSIVMTIWTDGSQHGDVKQALEIGFSILMDKPIIVIQFDDTPVSERLARAADVVISVDRDAPPQESHDLIQKALEKVLGTGDDDG